MPVPAGDALAQHISAEREAAHLEWWAQFWNRSHILVGGAAAANATTTSEAERVTQVYAATRYVQAIQTRTWVRMTSGAAIHPLMGVHGAIMMSRRLG